jgi:hypothetical protein
MKKLLVFGVLVLGFSTLALADPGNGKARGKNGDPPGKHDSVAMPEGMAFELPLFVIGAGLWSMYRQRRLRKAV